MTVEVLARALGFAGSGVHAKSHTTTTNLRSIAFARHIARSLVKSGASSQFVTAETLSAILCAGHGKAAVAAVGYTLLVCDGALTDISEFDTAQNTVAGILVAAVV